MKNIRQSQINIHRDAWVEINLESIAHNIREFRKNIPADKKMLGIVKADAYLKWLQKTIFLFQYFQKLI